MRSQHNDNYESYNDEDKEKFDIAEIIFLMDYCCMTGSRKFHLFFILFFL